ncbi:MAG: hypothetical protein H0U35_08405 [Sporichthyaceae bacterium]|nr:hypothetical protein [Sporichthyaceae bacterium]
MAERETDFDGEVGAEVPDADALEQRRPVSVSDQRDDELAEFPVEADPADRAEQARVVETDDDEYR